MDDIRPSSTTPDLAQRLRARLLELAEADGTDPDRRPDPAPTSGPEAAGSPPADGGVAPVRPPTRRRRTPLVAAPLVASRAGGPDPAASEPTPAALAPVVGAEAARAETSGAGARGEADALLDLDVEPWPLGDPEIDDRWTRARRISTRSALAVALAAVLLVATVGILIAASRSADPGDERRDLAGDDGVETGESTGSDLPGGGALDRPRLPDLAVPGLTGADRAPALPRRDRSTPITGVPGSRSTTPASAAPDRAAAGPTAPRATTTAPSTPAPSDPADATTPTTLLRPRAPGAAPTTTTTVPPTTSTTTTTQPAPSADVSTIQDNHEARTQTSGFLFPSTTTTFTLDLRVANAGPSTAEGVTVTIRVTSGTVQVASPPAGWTCEQTSSIEVRCSTAALAAGDAAMLRATGSGNGTTATWSTSASTPDPDLGNGSGSVA